MAITLRDIAKRANVSHMTVSRVLNKRSDVVIAEETRKRVQSVAKEMGYQPNRAARTLATGRTHMIGLWMSHAYNPFHASVVDQLRELAGRHGYEIVIGDIATWSHPDTNDLHFSKWPVDGVFAMDIFDPCQLLQSGIQAQTPFVNMGAYYLETSDFVGIDLYHGGLEATRHLVDIGCRRIACLVPSWADHVGDARRDAYTTVMQQAGQEPIYIPTFDSRADARQALRQYLATHACPDGLFCFNDNLAIGAYRGLRDQRIEIPRQIAMVGCDGIEDVEYLDCPLSTIVQPVREMCELAWQFLERRMKDPSIPLQVAKLRSYLVVRESSRRESS